MITANFGAWITAITGVEWALESRVYQRGWRFSFFKRLQSGYTDSWKGPFAAQKTGGSFMKLLVKACMN
jgi:hypothetical protein